MSFGQYTTKSAEEVLYDLRTSEDGLPEKEVKVRQKSYGLNEVRVKETTIFDILIRQFKSPFFYLLFIASFVAFLVGEHINSFVILGFVFINVVIGFFQESRAVKTAAILKKYVPLKARVKRNGKEKIIEQKFLVPGDVVLLEAGNIVPADLRLIKAKNFLVDEEVLSGESVPVVKTNKAMKKEAKEIFKAENIVFTASSVVSGEAEGVAIGTGKKTFFGQVVKLTAETVRESAYEKSMLKFSKLILRLVISSIIIIFIINLIIRGTTNFFDFLIFCIALIVSVIPETLPVVLTFAFSQEALKLAKNKVVVKRLSSIEDLGDIEILCTDKTGTLTENKLYLEGIFSKDKEKCLLYGLLSSSFMKEEIDSTQNPFDVALFQVAKSVTRKTLSQFEEISEIPFDNNRLRNSALLEDKKGKKILIVKGVPEVILSLSSNSKKGEDLKKIKKKIKSEGMEGKRILAVGYKEFDKNEYSEKDEKKLKFLGYFSFTDPLKKTTKPAMSLAKKLGVQIKILTGDAPEVAGAVGKEIGLVGEKKEVILGKTLESLNKRDFAKACENFHVFARLSPATKFKIVETLQKKFEVGFLGEGINDAPSLKIANVAIAVRNGADICREISDIILLRKDLRVIVDGIKKGRSIFSNINKYIKCTLASNFGNFYSIALISLFIPFLPMLPIQILLVNFLSDFPLIAIASDRVDVEELKKPKTYQFNQVILFTIILAFVSSIFDLVFFFIFYKSGAPTLQTLWFIESILTEIVLIFSIRSSYFFLKARAPSLPLTFFSFLATVITLILPFTNFGREFFYFILPSASSVLVVLSLIFGYFIISELVKLIYYHQLRTKTIKVNSKHRL